MCSATANNDTSSPMAYVRELLSLGRTAEAETFFRGHLESSFPFKITSLRFDTDNALALNSLRGFITTQDGQDLFFKFHQEKGEQSRLSSSEYYKAEILEKAGFPIISPKYQSGTVGAQIVIYPRIDLETFHDACRKIEAAGCPDDRVSEFAQAYADFQKIVGNRYLATLHTARREQVQAESVHTLFHRRLVNNEQDSQFGGRVAEYYLGKPIVLPDGQTISFEKFASLKWEINGQQYDTSLLDAFESARILLAPGAISSVAAVTAHGDDHTGNLWWDPSRSISSNRLSYFDPAFAGNDIPALLAPVKALFHVVFAHPNWLYDPQELDISLQVAIDDSQIKVTHNWDLTPLRSEFLNAQLEHVWKPLLKEMKTKGTLPDNWEDYVRAALFCCPTLCKNLLPGLGAANPLTPDASVLAFSVSTMLASAPAKGQDKVSKFMTELKASL